MADNKPEILGATAFKPVERKGWEAVRYFLHNPETGEYFTRTPKSWALITGFYLIYYSCLAAFWAACLAIFLTTLPDNSPRWEGPASLIGESPGLGLKPGQDLKNIDSSMIQFDKNTKDDTKDGPDGWGGWAERASAFIETYTSSEISKICSPSDPSTDDQACKFDTSLLGPCASGNHGYDVGKPCVFLKLNKIYGVVNEAYDGSDLGDGKLNWHDDMSDDLKALIGQQSNKQQVWIECKGENPADKEALKSVTYFPSSQGFPLYYFPYKKQDGYLSPVVAVQFEVPDFQLVHVECRAFAHKIGYNRRDRIGINHLELHVLS